MVFRAPCYWRGMLSLRQALGWGSSNTSIGRRHTFTLSAALYFPGPLLFVTLDGRQLGQFFSLFALLGGVVFTTSTGLGA